MKNIEALKRKFQDGGVTPPAPASPAPTQQAAAPQPTPEQGGQEDPMAQIQQMIVQFLSSQDPNQAVQIVNMLAEMMQLKPTEEQAGTAPQAPVEQQPMDTASQIPAQRRGGKLPRFVF